MRQLLESHKVLYHQALLLARDEIHGVLFVKGSSETFDEAAAQFNWQILMLGTVKPLSFLFHA